MNIVTVCYISDLTLCVVAARALNKPYDKIDFSHPNYCRDVLEADYSLLYVERVIHGISSFVTAHCFIYWEPCLPTFI